MIFDTDKNLKYYASFNPAFDAIAKFIEENDMKAMECGVDFKGDSNSWEVCEMCTFENREDFVKFGTDPYHAEVRKYMAEVIEEGAKIDYEL